MGRKTCRLPGCGRLITAKGRTKYCCAECAAEANRLRQRRPERQAETKARRALRFAAKSPIKRRVCLACDRMFMSEGPWNRICRPCKRKRASHQHEGDRSAAYYWINDGTAENMMEGDKWPTMRASAL